MLDLGSARARLKHDLKQRAYINDYFVKDETRQQMNPQY